jgi:hypothetical protein
MKKLMGLATCLMACSSTPPDPARDEVSEIACPEILTQAGDVTVVVEDTQVDPLAPGIREHVSGCFRWECDDDDVPAEGTFEARKQNLLAEILQPSTKCRLRPSVWVKRRKKTLSERVRARWNAAIRSHRYPDGLLDNLEL